MKELSNELSSLEEKIAILADAAKYDASCSTSGSAREGTAGGLGSCAAAGICHSWSDDGRCVALLKLLLSNVCRYDCAYCINRASNDIPRASFSPEEVVRLTMDFYRRNYIEGLFLSSGIFASPDATMERMLEVVKILRQREGYSGYIHMKSIPGASPELISQAGFYVDRLSINIELPSQASLGLLAPHKRKEDIFSGMAHIGRERIGRLSDGKRSLAPHTTALSSFSAPPTRTPTPLAAPERPSGGLAAPAPAPSYPEPKARAVSRYAAERNGGYFPSARRFSRSAYLPAGQTTQLIVGASPENDRSILCLMESLYKSFDLKRVYYSAYIPLNNDSRLPPQDSLPPLAREHRLYQADWLFRFYKFSAGEILDDGSPFLDDELDPKAAWALRHPERFPIDLQKAGMDELLRVPGLGPISARRILQARRKGALRPEQLSKLGVVMKRARHFILVGGRRPDEAMPHDPEKPSLERLKHQLLLPY